MITLLVDALIAAVKLLDRTCTAVEQNVRLRATPPEPVADAQRPGAGGAAIPTGAGSPIQSTSALLSSAAMELDYAFPAQKHPVITGLIADLRDRAADFASVGD